MKTILRAVGITVLVFAGVARGQIDWENEDGGEFSDPDNWSAGVPGVTDTARFNLNAEYEVQFTEDITNLRLLMADGVVTFNLYDDVAETRWTYTVTGTGGSRSTIMGPAYGAAGSPGDTRPAVLILDGGDMVSTGDLILSYNQRTVGRIELTNGATLTTGGGVFQVGGATGSYSELHIPTGTQVVMNNGITIAQGAGDSGPSNGLVRVTGPALLDESEDPIPQFHVASGNPVIGNNGNGRLEILNGAFARTSGNLSIGGVSSQLIISGENTLLADTGTVAGMSATDGLMMIKDGGRKTTGVSWRFSASTSASAVSTILVDGADSEWTLTFSNTTQGFYLGGDNGGKSGTARLLLSDGGTVDNTNTQTRIYEGSELRGHGNLSTPTLNNDGLIAPGLAAENILDPTDDQHVALAASTGTLNVTGNVVQTSTGTMRFQIGNPSNDHLNVTGNLTLAGTLEVVALGSPVLADGMTFNLFDWTGTLSGTFTDVDLFNPGSGLSWDTDNLYIDGTISVIPEPHTLGLLLAAGALLALRRRVVRGQ